jgi:hypothetical protein
MYRHRDHFFWNTMVALALSVTLITGVSTIVRSLVSGDTFISDLTSCLHGVSHNCLSPMEKQQ